MPARTESAGTSGWLPSVMFSQVPKPVGWGGGYITPARKILTLACAS
jgi:hypothetical protein